MEEEIKNNEEATEKQRKIGGITGKGFKPGQSGNPKGREKGIPNRATLFKKIGEMIAEPPESILNEIKEMYPKVFEYKNVKLSNNVLVIIRQYQKAIIEGDTRAAEMILDSAFGKIKENIEVGGEMEIKGELKDEDKELLKKAVDYARGTKRKNNKQSDIQETTGN